MIRITTAYFVAAVVIRDHRVVRCAPILQYMQGWSVEQVCEYCEKKHWHWSLE